MSEKQEIYLEILRWALPQLRNTLSPFRQARWLPVLFHKKQRALRSAYVVAQLVHNIHGILLAEDFTNRDIWFLNVQARSFIEQNNDKTCYSYSLFAYYIQQLFKIVPANLKSELTWSGPDGDYDWARPRRGDEL